MDRNHYRDEMEDLIREKADQYKMYPSDRVWKEINRSLHPRRKWYWIGFAVLLSGIGFYSVNELLEPLQPAKMAIAPPEASSQSSNTELPGDILPFKAPENEKTFLSSPFIPMQSDLTVNDLRTTAIILPIRPDQPLLKDGAIFNQIAMPSDPSGSGVGIIRQMLPAANPENPVASSVPNRVEMDEALDRDRMKMIEHYAIFELEPPKTNRFSLQFSFSPTVSYRRMTGKNDASLLSDIVNIPNALNIRGDVNKLVNHMPAPGLEMGTSLLYTVNKNLRVKAGLQFNYSRYSIKAYDTPGEIATIALNNRSGIPSRALYNLSRIRNFGGDSEVDFQNQYFQFSAPVGIELRVAGNKKLQLSVATTIQPTYLLNGDSYMITTDYKNYTQQPSLVRRWNMHTGAEAFISYQSSTVRWQVGPQFRYQLLSSFVKEYPVKENLMEYGVKIGVTKTLK